ncbi:FAD-binding protein [Picrophilus oshimae]|uniref:Electron transfer flavoprotein alpha and beta-subunit n=1 Tax=Picrophilus torridus (strain ATCC 700027 / DSM 9790 / JCM 10055 / NBRC 100828 / KAW 2/3) TaxID=1122961 RepID=Q6L1Q7_PICTO|nr:FAD-binding protein [Picrophilus oshimae]AAT43095.1 electron transfer flavoprotein alpha and beta-subunit [Picrophilus oshimae DSM 9789]
MILVLIKQVPDVNEIRFDEKTRRIVRDNVKLLMNSFDKKAVEESIRLSERYNLDTAVATMGPPQAITVLEEAIRMGVNSGYLISDRKFGGADTWVTSKVLSEFIKMLRPDIVLMGKYSLDGETSQVPPETAYMAGYNFISSVSRIDIENDDVYVNRDEDYGISRYRIKMPLVISVSEKINKARQAGNINVENRIKVITADDIKNISGSDSLTVVTNTFQSSIKRNNKFIGFDEFLSLINNFHGRHESIEKKMLKPPGDSISLGLAVDDPETSMEIASKMASIGNSRIVFIGNIEPERLKGIPCHEYIYLKSDTYGFIDYATDYIKKMNPLYVLIPSNLNGRDIAANIAARLSLGLTADCIDIKFNGKKLVQYKPSFGGGIIAEIESRTEPAMATIRPGMFINNYYGNPEVKIIEYKKMNSFELLESRTINESYINLDRDIIFGIGRGLDKDMIPKVLEIADKINAGVGATRKVVDINLMPRQVQIGLTGRSISPGIYIALGISGSDNHVVGLRYAGKIIAVNNSIDANIFKYSDYGILMDVNDFVRRLHEKVFKN